MSARGWEHPLSLWFRVCGDPVGLQGCVDGFAIAEANFALPFICTEPRGHRARGRDAARASRTSSALISLSLLN